LTLQIQNKFRRKFKPIEFFCGNELSKYFLLPFRFFRINENREVLVNEVGDFLIVPVGSTEMIVNRRISRESYPDLYSDLLANFIISEEKVPKILEVISTRYRTKKSFLDNFTSLHIFVMTLRCEHSCHYCQVSRVTKDKTRFDMKREHVDLGIDIMLKSPSENVTMEFQGGEAMLAFENVAYAVESTKSKAKGVNKNITFVLCTNLASVTTETLEFCRDNDILISTSLDGPDFIHNRNRKKKDNDSYQLTIRGINMAREILGHDRVSALMTTTNLSLKYPHEIVDEYFKNNFRSIFLRSVSPYGFAVRNESLNLYQSSEFLTFYKKALGRILEYNLCGEYFREDFASILLKKMMTPFPVGFVDLQSPSGMLNNVIVFNYDGNVYATDESRMLAEMSDFSFLIGKLGQDSYEDIFYGEKAMQLSEYWTNESLAGCSECAFQPYCGSDPVWNYSTQGDMYGYRPTSSFCKKNMEIIRHLFELMDNDKDIEKIFLDWTK